jgi:hypothetical protein
MLTEYSLELRCLLGAFAVWLIVHLLVAEDGPWDLVVKLRALLGDSVPGRAMDCFYCASIWVAVPFAFVVADHWPGRVLSWLALSGAASLFEQATKRDLGRIPTQDRNDGGD